VRPHIPKVDTGDDYDFMCGTHAFGAAIETRHVCQSCISKTLEIVELLAQAHDSLRAYALHAHRSRHVNEARHLDKLVKRIDKALGKRATVDYANEAP